MESAARPGYVLVTGDIVVDCHLYGGVKTAATSFSEPGTVYTRHLGGAVLTRKLLCASSQAAGASFDTRPGLSETGLLERLPQHLHSYGVWTAHPAAKGSRERVWRVERDFGYGPAQAQHDLFQRDAELPASPPVLTVIDDGGILFRHGASREVWPDISGEGETLYLLKMTWPLCRNDLWEELKKVSDRLIVVISAADLRREDAQINTQLSWEQCAEHTVTALQNDPLARELLRAAQVIVSFRSAGALLVSCKDEKVSACRLVFDPLRLEGEFDRQFEGTAYGFQTCLTAAIAHHLMAAATPGRGSAQASPLHDAKVMERCLNDGIVAGLKARRRLLELGHGPLLPAAPGFPIEATGEVIAKGSGGFVSVEVPFRNLTGNGGQWSILSRCEGVPRAGAERPLVGLAMLTARHGGAWALSEVPALKIGPVFTVDRNEIESMRTLEALIRGYDQKKVQKKPLSLGVFGPPGAGKSFGVKALAAAVLGPEVPLLEFNLSQFKGPDELIGALHRVRDAVLGGTTPVVFWDEFDSQRYKWLQYLLAPMQDGSFQEGQITHPIGKCIFIFAGGTSPAIEQFGVAKPQEPTAQELNSLDLAQREKVLQEHRERKEEFDEFKLLKGPDFVSRLHGFLNILGPNRQQGTRCPDVTWPIRRALMLRGVLGMKGDERLDIDFGLLYALLYVPEYRHGARSFEKIILTLAGDRTHGRLHRSALPPQPLLDRDTDAGKFHELLTQADAFKNHPNLEDLAAAIHNNFLEQGKKSKLKAEMQEQPHLAWSIHPAIQKVYDELSADIKASNRAAARRIPEHLALIDFVLKPQESEGDVSWKEPLKEALEKHLDRLAQAEHLGWSDERISNGWSAAAERNDALKQHNRLVPWAELSPSDQDKDRAMIRAIVEILDVAKFKAEPLKAAS